MSKTVDSRIVEMQFDNKDFEKNVSQSMSTLDNLNRQLKDLEGTKGLEELGKSAKNLNFDEAGQAVDGFGHKVSALEELAIGAFRAMGAEAYNLGKNLIKSLSVDQIMAGWNEYETKMTSVQTIMNSTGEDIDVVKDHLEQLNHYADQTIYSFSDMTSNIGKFTNAGVDLTTATEAIKGISNWAALAGANANEAGRAMYNISQSMSGGYMQLIDWKSVKFANMATQTTLKNLAETAEVMGTIKKNADGTYDTLTRNMKGKAGENLSLQSLFNEGLNYQWLTTDVLMETMDHFSKSVDQMKESEKEAYETKLKGLGYTADQIASIEKLGNDANKAATEVKTFSMLLDTLKEAVGSGWAQSFEYIFGDLLQAKELWTGISDEIGGLIGKVADWRNAILKEWGEAGGRDAIIEGLANLWRAVKEFVKPIGEAFSEIFNGDATNNLLEASFRFRDFAKNLHVSSRMAEGIKGTFKGLFSVIKMLGTAVKGMWQLAQPLLKLAGKILEIITSIIGKIGNLISGMSGMGNAADGTLTVFDKLVARIEAIGEPLKTFKENLAEIFNAHWLGRENGIFNVFNTLFEILKSITALIIDTVSAITGIDLSKFEGNVIGAMNHVRDSVRLMFYNIGEFLQDKFGAVGSAISKVLMSGKGFFTDAEFRNRMLSAGQNLIDGLVEGMRNAITNLPNTIKHIVDTIVNTFKDLFGIHSPSTVFAMIGMFLMEGLSLGIRTGISDYVKPIIHKVVDTISELVQTGNLLNKVKEVGGNIVAGIGVGIQNGWQYIPKAIVTIVDNIINTFKKLLGIHSPSTVMAAVIGTMIVAGIAVGISQAIPLLGPAFDGIKQFFESLNLGWIKDFFADVGEFLKSFAHMATTLAKGLFDSLSSVVEIFGPKFKEYFEKMDAETMIKELRKLLALVAVLITVLGVAKGLASMTRVAEKGIGALGKFGELAGSIGELTDTLKKDVKVRMVRSLIRDLAITLGAIVAAIYVMGKMDPEVAKRGAISVAIIGGAISLIVGTILAISAKSAMAVQALMAMNQFGKVFLYMGGSILMLAMAIKMIGKVNFSEMNQAKAVLLGIGLFFLAYEATMLTLSRVFGNAAVNSIWKVLLGAAGSVYLLASAIAKIANVPEEGFERALLTIAILEMITMGFSAFIVMASKMDKGKTAAALGGLGFALIGVGICVNLIAGATRHMAYLAENSPYWVAGLAAIVGIMAMLGIIMVVASKMNRAWKSLLSLAALFGVMGLVVKMIGTMEPKEIAKGVVTLGVLELMVMALVAFTSAINYALGSDKTADVAKTLVGASVAIGILAAVVKMLGDIDPKAAIKALGVIFVLGAVMAGLIAISGLANGLGGTLTSSASGQFKGFKNSKFSRSSQKSNGVGFKQLIGIALSLSILAYAVSKLSTIPQDGLMGATSSIILLGAVIAGLIWLMSYVGKMEGIKIGTIVSITTLILVLSVTMVLFAQFADQWQGMLAGAIGLGAVIVAIGAMFKLIGSVPKIEKKQIFTIIATLLTIGILAGTLLIVGMYSKMMDWKVIAAFAAGLGVVLLSLAGALRLAKGVDFKTALALSTGCLALIPAAAALAIVGHFVAGENWPAIIAGAIGMGIAIGALALALRIAQGVNIMGALTLVVASTALIAAGFGLSLVAQYDWHNIMAAMVAMSGVLIVATLCTALLGALAEGSGIAIAGALLLVVVAGALALAGLGLSQVAQHNWKNIHEAMLAMMAVIGVAVAAAAILGGLAYAAGASIIGTVLLAAIAVALLIFAEALDVAANACQTFLTAISEFFVPDRAQSILNFFTELGDGIPAAVMHMTVGLESGLAVIKAAIPIITQIMVQIAEAIGDGLIRIIETIETKGVEVARAIGKMIDSIKTEVENALGINSPSRYFMQIGQFIIQGLVNGIKSLAPAPVKAMVGIAKSLVSGFCKFMGINSPSLKMLLMGGFAVAGLVKGLQDGEGSVFDAGSLLGSATEDGFMSGASGLLNGDVAKQIGEQLGIDIPANFKISELSSLGDVLKNIDVGSLDLSSMSAPDLQSFVDQLKEAGVDASQLDGILENIQNKDNTVEFTAELDTTNIEKETKKVMDGTYGSSVSRWKKMYEEYLKAYNGDVAKALSQVVEVQNKVNKDLGSSVTHNMDEMGKKLGIAAEELKKAKESLNEDAKKVGARDFTKEKYEGTKATGNDIAKANDEARKQLMNNTSYADFQAKTEGKVTAERKAQTSEAYKQLEANTHITTEQEKQTAEANLRANQQMMANGTLTDEKRKQLDAENKTYQATIDKFNAEKQMRSAIEGNTEAQKKQTEAVKETKKAVDETAKAASTPSKKAVTYGSQEYYDMAKGKSINTQAAKAIAKADETKPVQAKTKVEVEPEVVVKEVDTSQVKEKVVKQVELESKKIKAAVEIKPKVDVVDANRSIDEFKRKTQDLSTSIPKTFSNVTTEISKSMSSVSATMRKEGATFENTCKEVFKKAANSASTAMSSKEIIDKFITAGKNMASGLIKGMNAKKDDVTKAAKALGNAASNGTKSALKEHSPSKVMEEVGIYAGEGLENGMLGMIRKIFNTGQNMGDAALQGVAQNIDNIQYALENANLDYSPSIVPVIDPSQVQYGMAAINNIIGQNRVTGIQADVAMSTQYNQSQIDILKQQMGEVQGAINNLGDILLNQPTPEVNANVVLQGDADGVFKLVRDQNSVYAKMHGKSAFA